MTAAAKAYPSSTVDTGSLGAYAPEWGLYALDILERAGFEAWFVGGWVRDALLGRAAHDVDICCSAPWELSLEALCAAGVSVFETGTAHGTITAVIDTHPIEITTFRKDGAYSDGRHPDSVTFVDDVAQDLARRDFTINAMAWNPRSGLLDLYDGVSDLTSGIIRCVGNPDVRFHEDALRLLRAVRFACRFGFAIEDATQTSLRRHASELSLVAHERIGTELRGIVNSGRLSWALRCQSEVMEVAIPSLVPMKGFDQKSPYHSFDVLEHTIRVCEGIEYYSAGAASERLRWAALLHDIGKPLTFTCDDSGQGHFFGHPTQGAQMAKDYLHTLALPGSLIREIVALVRYHDRPFKRTPNPELKILSQLSQMAGATSRTDDIVLMHEMFDLRRADALAKSEPCRAWATELNDYEKAFNDAVLHGACWQVRDLAISGNDVIEAFALPSGPAVGECLNWALDGVIEGKTPNAKDELLGLVEKKLVYKSR